LAETSGVLKQDKYDSSQEFLAKMDAGDLDDHFSAELKKLSQEQLEQVAHALMERESKRRE